MLMKVMMIRLNGVLNLEKLKWLRKMKSNKNWTEPIFDSEVADLILGLEPADVKKFNAFNESTYLSDQAVGGTQARC